MAKGFYRAGDVCGLRCPQFRPSYGETGQIERCYVWGYLDELLRKVAFRTADFEDRFVRGREQQVEHLAKPFPLIAGCAESPRVRPFLEAALKRVVGEAEVFGEPGLHG